MDKQNEEIKDLEVKEIPYDMGGQAAVRSWGKKPKWKFICCRIKEGQWI